MISLVTLEQVKERLKVDGNADDSNLEGLILGASKMVLNYLERTEDDYFNSDGVLDVNSDGYYEEVEPEVETATILLVGILYRDPDGTESEKWSRGFLPNPVVATLYPLRSPTI